MKMFAKMTVLRDVAGRSNYIRDNKERHQGVGNGNVLSVASTMPADGWVRLAKEQAWQTKGTGKTVEGRELMVTLDKKETNPKELAQKICTEFTKAYGVPCEVAIHTSKNEENLHAHIVFSDRPLLSEVKQKKIKGIDRELSFGSKIRKFKEKAFLEEFNSYFSNILGYEKVHKEKYHFATIQYENPYKLNNKTQRKKVTPDIIKPIIQMRLEANKLIDKFPKELRQQVHDDMLERMHIAREYPAEKSYFVQGLVYWAQDAAAYNEPIYQNFLDPSDLQEFAQQAQQALSDLGPESVLINQLNLLTDEALELSPLQDLDIQTLEL